MEVIVRFAPSPTGIPHVGNIRTALFDYFFAASKSGKFILRIEDTDQARRVEGAVEAVKESLSWLEAKWDEEHIQSTRLSEYRKVAKELIEKGKAKEEDGAVRFLVSNEGSTNWKDLIGEKSIEYKNSDIEDFIILKKDGYPTYHLANVVDDHLMNISHVIRGEDWIPSAPKHILIYEAMGWSVPHFAHVPNVLGADGKKLSKRRGAKSVLDYKKEGILAEALLNYLMLLGWSPKNDREILSRDEIIEEFSLENVNAAPATFDERKLLWMNGEYIRSLSIAELKERLIAFDKNISSINNFEELISLAQTRMKTLADFKILAVKNEEIEVDDKLRNLVDKLREEYKLIDSWNADSISKKTFEVRDEVGASTKDIFRALSGKSQSLPFDQVAEIEGRDATISWLEQLSSNK